MLAESEIDGEANGENGPLYIDPGEDAPAWVRDLSLRWANDDSRKAGRKAWIITLVDAGVESPSDVVGTPAAIKLAEGAKTVVRGAAADAERILRERWDEVEALAAHLRQART